MRSVLHLIPYDGIGGVELAAASAQGARLGDLMLERMFVFENVSDRSGRSATFDLGAFIRSARRLVVMQPDLVILSLWRSVIVGGLARLFGCRAPMVLFLHNARDAHLIDWLVTRIALLWVSAVWADSSTTLVNRLSVPRHFPTRVISYLIDRPLSVRNSLPPKPDFIFWGRLALQKDPLRMLDIFAELYAYRPDATLTIIGPDGGLERALSKKIDSLSLHNVVKLSGPLSRDEILNTAVSASFYLQTSRYEGMALSVVEAMQVGLVPVVTPVGEIQRYTVDGSSAIWKEASPVAYDHSTVQKILFALDNTLYWQDLQAGAISTSSKWPLYKDDLLSACLSLLGQSS